MPRLLFLFFIRIDDMLSQHVGKDQMIFPPFEPERVQELGALVPTDFDIMGAGWREVGTVMGGTIYVRHVLTRAVRRGRDGGGGKCDRIPYTVRFTNAATPQEPVRVHSGRESRGFQNM